MSGTALFTFAGATVKTSNLIDLEDFNLRYGSLLIGNGVASGIWGLEASADGLTWASLFQASKGNTASFIQTPQGAAIPLPRYLRATRANQDGTVPANSVSLVYADATVQAFTALSAPVALTLWVDGTNGNDSFSGNSAITAFKTIGRALLAVAAAFPGMCITQAVVINLKRGIYSETLRINGIVSLGAAFTIQGTEFDVAVLSSGVTNGVIAGVASRIVNVAGAGWTPGDMTPAKCIFMRMTSGTQNGKLFPVAANSDATHLEIAPLDAQATGLTGATFELVTMACQLIKPTDTNTNVLQACVFGASANAALPTGDTTNRGGLHLKNLYLNGTGCGKTVFNRGDIYFEQCSFDSSPSSVVGGNNGGKARFVFCNGAVKGVVGGFTGSTAGGQAADVDRLEFDGCVFQATAFPIAQMDYPGSVIMLRGSNSIFELTGGMGGSGGAIFEFRGTGGGNELYCNSGLVIKNCDYVLKCQGAGNRVSFLSQPLKVVNANYSAFWFFDDVVGASGMNGFFASDMQILAVGGTGGAGTGWGIRFSTGHSHIKLVGCTISNCATGGVSIGAPTTAGSNPATHNDLAASGCTMANNGDGTKDIAIDSTEAAQTYASVIASAGNRISNATQFSTAFIPS